MSKTILAFVVLVLAISRFAFSTTENAADGEVAYHVLAWPWYIPAGSTVAFVFGILLGKPRRGAGFR